MGVQSWKPLGEASSPEVHQYIREWRAMRDKCGWTRWSQVPPAWRHAGEELLEWQLQQIEQLSLFDVGEGFDVDPTARSRRS